MEKIKKNFGFGFMRLPMKDGDRHTQLPRVLRCAAKILYGIMLEGLLCLTKPSKRAVRGAVLLAPASMQERFCASWHNFYSI